VTITVKEQLSAAREYAELWAALMPDLAAPPTDTFVRWAGAYTSDLVSLGINRAGRKYRKLKETTTPMTTEDTERYASSVMKNESLGLHKFPSSTNGSNAEPCNTL
jgi:hypothetical protein